MDEALFDRYVAEHLEAWTAELVDFCAIPSEASDPAALHAAADWIADRYRRLGHGTSVDVVTNEGDPPLVIAEIGEGRTLLALQHYDVQPAAPWHLWTTPPYQPDVRGGRVYARGACDNKGELMARIWGLEAYLATVGELPCRVRFLCQGQEEGGGDSFPRLLAMRPGVLDGDAVLSEGGGMDVEGRAVVFGGVRGMVSFELICRTIAYDAHSSLANLLPSAAIRIVQALSTFWDDDGVPAIDGLSDQVREATPAQLATLDATPEGDLEEELFPEFGIERFIAGRAGIDAVRSLNLDPTVNIQGLWSGYTGPGGNTITPAEAHARVDIRLVPDMDPETVVATVRRHLEAKGFGDVEVVPNDDAYRAWWTPPDHPLIDASMRVSEAVTGKPSVLHVSAAGTEPMWDVAAANSLPATTIGATDPDIRVHAPDESYKVESASFAARMFGRFIDAFAALPEVPRVG
jgi:acetylornithine deacetylase/succinyl-diaminopimelate desuccinylase-like protein